MELPELNKDDESVSEAVENHGRKLIPWLETPRECDDCGVYCYAEHEFVDEMSIPMDIWKCRECGNRYYRDDEPLSL